MLIDTSEKSDCFKCNALGTIKGKPCDVCNGTGVWIEDSAIIVTQDKDGNQIAMQIDQLGK